MKTADTSLTRTRSTRPYAILAAVSIGLLLHAFTINAAPTDAAKSEWVFPGPDGNLAYKTTASGDKIMDFSTAGYMGGGVALPSSVPSK